MKEILYKLFLGKPEYNKPIKHTAYHSHKLSIYKIWINAKHHDTGLEKILRLTLVGIQIIFPGIHIRNFFGKMGTAKKNLAVEFYVMFKTVLPLIFLCTGWYLNKVVVGIAAYMLFETMSYVASMIFVSDAFVKPRSYRRNILMLFLNYLEISFSFAVIYGGLHLLGDHGYSVIDYIYFSIVTSTTIGYGDMHPETSFGKIAVCNQAIMIAAFIILFLNFFGSKVETLHQDDE